MKTYFSTGSFFVSQLREGESRWSHWLVQLVLMLKLHSAWNILMAFFLRDSLRNGHIISIGLSSSYRREFTLLKHLHRSLLKQSYSILPTKTIKLPKYFSKTTYSFSYQCSTLMASFVAITNSMLLVKIWTVSIVGQILRSSPRYTLLDWSCSSSKSWIMTYQWLLTCMQQLAVRIVL